jgi:hypothetical protein
MPNVLSLTIAHDEYYNVILQVTAESCRAARFPVAIARQIQKL